MALLTCKRRIDLRVVHQAIRHSREKQPYPSTPWIRITLMTRYKHSSHSNDARIAGLGQVPFIVNRPGNQRRDIAEFQMQLMVEFADHPRCRLLNLGRSMTLGAHHLRTNGTGNHL